MDEIEALNAEWEKIKSGTSTLEDVLRGGSSNSSDASSTRRRKKRSRWSDEKVNIEQISNGSVEIHEKPSITFGDSVSKLVAERNRSLAQEVSSGPEGDGKPSESKSREADRRLVRRFIRPMSDEEDAPCDCDSSQDASRVAEKRTYRNRRSYSDGSDSDSESCSKLSRSSAVSPKQASAPPMPPVSGFSSSSNSQNAQSSFPTTEPIPDVGPFLERKTTVIVKNLADWVTVSHILQDVKSAQLRSYEDAGIVRKKDRGAPYRYAYVDFLTNTTARRWIEIRKGFIVIGSQKFQMELTLKDWECSQCKVFNLGKAVVCYSCRNAKNQDSNPVWQPDTMALWCAGPADSNEEPVFQGIQKFWPREGRELQQFLSNGNAPVLILEWLALNLVALTYHTY